jgi:nitrogen fixation/metabolism regulation signal transduction histidine kinase
MKTNKKLKKRAWQISLFLGLIIEIVFIVGAVVSMVKTGEFIETPKLIAFIAIAIWIYIAYLKQRTIDVSKSVVDEKIKTHSLIEVLKDGIIVLDHQDNVLIMNDKASELTGLDETTLLAQKIHNFINPELQELIQSGHSGEKNGTIPISGKKIRMSVVVLPPNAEGESNKLLHLYEGESATGSAQEREGDKCHFISSQYLQYAEKLLSSAADNIRDNILDKNKMVLLNLIAVKTVISAINLVGAGSKLETNKEESVSLKELIAQIVSIFSTMGVEFDLPMIEEGLKIKIDRNVAEMSLYMILLNAIHRAISGNNKKITIKIAPMGGNIGVAIIEKTSSPTAEAIAQLFDAQYIKTPPQAFYFNLYLAKEFLGKCGAVLTGTPHIEGGTLFTIMFPAG